MFVKSSVRKYIKDGGCNTATDVTETDILDLILKDILDNAIRRAKQNSRKTVLPRDL